MTNHICFVLQLFGRKTLGKVYPLTYSCLVWHEKLGSNINETIASWVSYDDEKVLYTEVARSNVSCQCFDANRMGADGIIFPIHSSL